MKKIIVISNDLIFKTKIESILRSQNLSAVNYTDFNSIDVKSFTELSLLIIVDLEIASIDLPFIFKKKKILGTKIFLLGYCSHVLTDLIKKANDSGFDEVLPRSKFVKILPNLLNNFDKHNK